MKNLWILTEEKPKRTVIIEILKKYSTEYNKTVEFDAKGIIVVPVFEEKKYSFTCEVYGAYVEGISNIYLKTVSGGSSFLDYLVIEQEDEPNDGDCSNMIMAFEETKTSDDESRNTGVYQRASKFVFLSAYSTNVKTYMLYNDELNAREDKKPSDTSIFGTNMLLTLGVEILGKTNLSWFKKFESIDELIVAKNSMRKPPAGNVPITITKYDDRIEISGRLAKPFDAGNIGHDPNIGALSLIARCLRILGWNKEIIITKHGVSQAYINKTKGKNKFLYICRLYGIELDGLIMPENYNLPEKYWHYEKSSEKITSILLHILAENDGLEEVYQNHAGCERGYFYTKDRKPITLPKKDSGGIDNLYIPDLILYESLSDTILLIEAKKLSTLNAGLIEIQHYDSIENEYIKKYYPNATDLRYLTLFGGNITKIPNDKVLVSINSDGSVIINENAPDFIMNLFEDN